MKENIDTKHCRSVKKRGIIFSGLLVSIPLIFSAPPIDSFRILRAQKNPHIIGTLIIFFHFLQNIWKKAGNGTGFTAETQDKYEHIYQYDSFGWVSSMGYRKLTAWCANVFTAKSDEALKAVGFYTTDSNCNYEIYIFTDPESGPISQAGPVTSIRGTSTTSGYNTVPLDTSVELAAGQKFSVVMKLTNPVYKYPIAVEIPFEDWSSKAKANAGESFVSSAGEAWYDLKSYSVYQNTNVRIKAFTDLILLPIEDFNTNVTSDYIKAFTDLILLPIAGFSTNVTSGYVPLSVQFTDLSENAETWNWDFGGGATSNDQNPVHTYSTAGTYTVTLEISNEYGTDSKTATIGVLKSTPAIIWFNPDNITNGTALSNIQLNAVATDPVTGNIVHGECVYTPPSGTILDVGSHILHVDFTPADIANYNTASKDFSINVLEPLFPPVASFRSNVTDGKPPLTVQFTDLSVEGSEQSWDFEDKTYSTDKNPVYL